MKLWRLPFKVPPLWPTYVGERRTKFAKADGIKARCYWELFALTSTPTPPPKTRKKSLHGK